MLCAAADRTGAFFSFNFFLSAITLPAQILRVYSPQKNASDSVIPINAISFCGLIVALNFRMLSVISMPSWRLVMRHWRHALLTLCLTLIKHSTGIRSVYD